jgi:putative phosphoribosyl transferase
MAARFRDRSDAGRRLAAELQEYANRPDVIVLALPRGGVPVAYEVAQALGAPLDVLVVRKLGLPSHPEFAMGAIASGGIRVLDREALRHFGVSEDELAAVTAVEQRELERRDQRYRDGRPFPDVRGKTVILIDDGLATGATMTAAASALRAQGPAKLIVAVPVSSPETCDAFRNLVDDIVCAVTPEPFYAVGLWYEDFSQTTDEEVHELLARGVKDRPTAVSGRATRESRVGREPRGRTEEQTGERTVRVAAGQVTLEGTLAIPRDARGVVLFAHGSGSSRHSPRNRFVADALREGGLATLLVDLLTADEEAIDVRTGHLRFDIGLLAQRLVGAIDWLGEQAETRDLRVGLFGASTGGGAALVAAAARPKRVSAVVSRGGRPDLARDALTLVQAPTLLIVGEWDEPVIELNERARDRMSAEVQLEIVPRATHLFEEPGALEEVARLARAWFVRHLAAPTQSTASARDKSPATRGRARARGEDELRR